MWGFFDLCVLIFWSMWGFFSARNMRHPWAEYSRRTDRVGDFPYWLLSLPTPISLTDWLGCVRACVCVCTSLGLGWLVTGLRVLTTNRPGQTNQTKILRHFHAIWNSIEIPIMEPRISFHISIIEKTIGAKWSDVYFWSRNFEDFLIIHTFPE